MTEQNFIVEWVAGFENSGTDDFDEIKRIRNRHQSWHYVEKPLKETPPHTSGIEKLQRLAGYLLENKGSQSCRADNVDGTISAKIRRSTVEP